MAKEIFEKDFIQGLLEAQTMGKIKKWEKRLRGISTKYYRSCCLDSDL